VKGESFARLTFPAVGRVAGDAAAVALTLDELRDVAGHLAEEQAHRDVGEGQSEGERNGERQDDDDDRDE
jgi:hypothetical protein